MNSRPTIILLLIALIFGSYIYFVEQKVPTTDEILATKNNIVKLNASKIDHISLKIKKETIHFEKKDGDWMITHPLTARADDQAITAILSEVEKLTKMRELDADPQFGLDDPQLRLSLVGNNQEDVLMFGNQTELGSNRYVKVNHDEKVYLIQNSLFDKLNKDLVDFRDKRLFYLDENDVKHLTVNYTDPASDSPKEVIFDFKATDKYGWDMLAPLKVAGDSDCVFEFLRKLTSTKISEFVEEVNDKTDLSKYGLAEPLGSITLSSEKKTEKLLIGSKIGGNVYLKKEGSASVVTVLFKPIADYLFKEVSFYRNKEVVPFYAFEVDDLYINDNGRDIHLQKEKTEQTGSWKIIEGETTKAADTAKVEAFLKAAKNIKIEKFIADNASDEMLTDKGLLNSSSFLKIINDKKEEVIVSFGNVDGDYCYMTLGDHSIYQVKKEIAMIVRFSEGFFDKQDLNKQDKQIDDKEKQKKE